MGIKRLLPMPPTKGPPLPQGLGLYWPWCKSVVSVKIYDQYGNPIPVSLAGSVTLIQGQSYNVGVKATNNSNRLGQPIAATLGVEAAAGENIGLLLPAKQEYYNFAPGETYEFQFPMSVPLGAAGQSGTIYASLLDPSGNHLQQTSQNVAIAAPTPPTYAATINLQLDSSLLVAQGYTAKLAVTNNSNVSGTPAPAVLIVRESAMIGTSELWAPTDYSYTYNPNETKELDMLIPPFPEADIGLTGYVQIIVFSPDGIVLASQQANFNVVLGTSALDILRGTSTAPAIVYQGQMYSTVSAVRAANAPGVITLASPVYSPSAGIFMIDGSGVTHWGTPYTMYNNTVPQVWVSTSMNYHIPNVELVITTLYTDGTRHTDVLTIPTAQNPDNPTWYVAPITQHTDNQTGDLMYTNCSAVEGWMNPAGLPWPGLEAVHAKIVNNGGQPGFGAYTLDGWICI